MTAPVKPARPVKTPVRLPRMTVVPDAATVTYYNPDKGGTWRPWQVAPWNTLTDAQRCGRLQRREFSDDEILSLPLRDFFGLYYSLLNYRFSAGQECPTLVPHPVVSAGLSELEARAVEGDLRERMFSLRHDLWNMLDPATGKTEMVLVPPPVLVVECKADSTGMMIFTIIMSVMGGVAGAVGGTAGLIVAAGQAAQSGGQQAGAARQAGKVEGYVKAIRVNTGRAIRGELVPAASRLQHPSGKAPSLALVKTWATSTRGWELARQLGLAHPGLACVKEKGSGSWDETTVIAGGSVAGCSPRQQELFLERMLAGRTQTQDRLRQVETERAFRRQETQRLTGLCSASIPRWRAMPVTADPVTAAWSPLVDAALMPRTLASGLIPSPPAEPVSTANVTDDAHPLAIAGLLLLLLL